MFDYLQQFNKLPKELREKVSSPAAMDVLLSLEKKYNVNLAMLVMQVMIKQIMFKDLPAYFSTEMGLDLKQAESLTKELREKLFFSVSNYLGLKPVVILNPEEKNLELLMKENNIVLPSQELLARCRKIILTYQKGVRSKIDTRLALEKDVAQGGLGLDALATERLLKAVDGSNVDQLSKKELFSKESAPQLSTEIQSEINRLINRQEADKGYDLKKNIEKGELKVPEVLVNRFQKKLDKLDLDHELEAPDKLLALEAPDINEVHQNISVKPIASPLSPPPPPPPPPVSGPSISLHKNLEQNVNLKNQIKVGHQESAYKPKIELDQNGPEIEKEPASLSKEKAAVVADLKPNLSGEAFKKESTTARSSLFAKFLNKDRNNEIKKSPDILSSHNLEEMVKTASLQSQIKSRPAAASDARPKMEDVKLRPKVMGPLEELRYLDIVNFRRLGENPEEITKKIITKIKLLERDGYDNLVRGVQAWRQSPVNKSYLRLMQEAVNKGITLSEALEARQNTQKEGLTKEEIEAIVDMNSKLMF